VDLNDPKWEFLRNDKVFLMDLYEDYVDPNDPWCFASLRKRDELAGALRQLADLFTSRRDLPIPKDGYARLDVIAGDGCCVAAISHGPGGYLFRIHRGESEQAAHSPNAASIAAADSPDAPVTRLPDTASATRHRPRGTAPRTGHATRAARPRKPS
jgi:hypothetical protein